MSAVKMLDKAAKEPSDKSRTILSAFTPQVFTYKCLTAFFL